MAVARHEPPHDLDAHAVLRRREWTDADLGGMGWRDTYVHALGASPERFEFMLDLDYVVRWEAPVPPDRHFAFWVAPATLVFHNPGYVEIDLRTQQGAFSVADLRREGDRPTPNGRMTEWRLTIEADYGEGSVRLWATGYTLYLRGPPQRIHLRSLTEEQRGGISFQRGH